MPGTTLPDLGRRFRNPRALGAGAGGNVVAVSDGIRRQDVALKLLPIGEDPAEFRTLRQLAHPGIVRVLDVGRAANGQAWFTMDLVRGRSFGEPPRSDVDGALRRIALLLDAVAALHDRGWVHGDLKPENVLVDPAGRPVVIDFGLALGLDSADRGLRGTLGWIAPEVLSGSDASVASDLYAFGVLAHQELGGGLPFAAESNAPGLEASDSAPLDLDDPRAGAIQAWVDGLLRRDPALRPSHARSALASLEALAGETLVPAEHRGARLGPTRPLRREPAIERAARALRDGALVFARGGPGAGRSTVLREVADRLRASGLAAASLELGGGPGLQRRSVEAFLADGGAPLPRRPGGADSEAQQAAEAWQQRRAELALHLRQALDNLGVLLVDDLDPRSLLGDEILRAVGARAGLGALVVLSHEDPAVVERATADRDGRAVVVLDLEPLQQDDAAGWLRSALGPVRSLRRLAGWLVDATGGQPGRLVETTRALLEDGLLLPGESEWYWHGDELDAWQRLGSLGPAEQGSAELAGQAEAARAEGDLLLALHLTRLALAAEDCPGSERGPLLLGLGALLRSNGDSRAAAVAFHQACERLEGAEADEARVREAEALIFAGSMEQALERLDAAPLGPAAHADGARARGKALLRLGRFDEARAAVVELEASAVTPFDRAKAAGLAANIHILQGRSADAEACARGAIDALAPSLDPGTVGTLQVALGNALRMGGKLDEAVAPYESALVALKRAGRMLDAARVANNLGILRYQQGDPLGAVAAWEEFRDSARRGGVALEVFNALNNLGCVYRDTGQPERARVAFEEALALAHSTSSTGLPMILGNLAEAEGVAGRADVAELRFGECVEAARAQDNLAEEAEAWRRLAQLRLDRGELDDLGPLLEKARGVANAASAGLEILLVRGLGRALAIREDSDPEALHSGRDLADEIESAGVRFEADRLRLRLAEALAARDRLEEAEFRLDELEARLRDVSARPELTRVAAVRRRIQESTRYHLADISAHYDALQDLTLALSRERDLGKLLDLILDRALHLIGEERGYVLLLDDDGIPSLTASRHVGREAISEDLLPSRSVTRRVIETGKPLVVLDVEKEDSLRKRQSVLAAGLRSVICVPILRGSTLLGLIYVDGREAVGGAAERKGSLLMACADAASVAIENARLIRALEEKNDALAIMAHELRTPIGAIIGFVSEVMAGETESPDEDLELLGLIKSQAERVSHMVNQVLGAARTHASALEWRREPVDPLELVLSSTDTLRPLARQAEVRLQRDADEDVPEFVGDRDRMIQVLVNLVGNAIKFSPRGGTIGVFARTVEGGLEICVEDEGPGVPPDRLEAIFEAYEQAGPAGQRDQGVGLGLAVSREIVLRHRGRIWAENRSEGGARFCFWLPSEDPATSGPSPVI